MDISSLLNFDQLKLIPSASSTFKHDGMYNRTAFNLSLTNDEKQLPIAWTKNNNTNLGNLEELSNIFEDLKLPFPDLYSNQTSGISDTASVFNFDLNAFPSFSSSSDEKSVRFSKFFYF